MAASPSSFTATFTHNRMHGYQYDANGNQLETGCRR